VLRTGRGPVRVLQTFDDIGVFVPDVDSGAREGSDNGVKYKVQRRVDAYPSAVVLVTVMREIKGLSCGGGVDVWASDDWQWLVVEGASRRVGRRRLCSCGLFKSP